MLALLAVAALVQMDCVDATCAAVREDGAVVTWGKYEPIEELKSDTPRVVEGLEGVKEVAAGSRFFLALKRDGTVWSWGFNRNGVLGNHTAPGEKLRDSATPVRVTGLSDVVQIEAGPDTAFAIKSDGTLWAWGSTGEGMLGVGVLDPYWRNVSSGQPFPVQVKGLTGVRRVSAGTDHTLAMLDDGRVVAFGSNQQGAVGDGTTENRWEPVEVKGIRDAVAVASGFGTSLAVLKDGTVRVWGSNRSGILLDGTREGFSATPRHVAGISAAVDARAGGGFFLVRLRDGTLRCWGHSAWGHCGDGKSGGYSLSIATPRSVSGVQWFGAGFNSGFARLGDGRILGWGAIYTEPMSDGKYHVALPVEWTPEGWARPKGRAARLP